MALDQITRALVDEFLSDAGMSTSGDAARNFERFVAFAVVSPHIDAAIDYENVMTGSGGDTGLDAIAILVNGELITDPDEVERLAASGATLRVRASRDRLVLLDVEDRSDRLRGEGLLRRSSYSAAQ